MLPLIEQNRVEIEALCGKFAVKRLELFGSAARGDFNPATSDLDFLVEFEDLGWRGLSDRYFGLMFALEDLLGRSIDLVDRLAVRNPYFLEVADQDVFKLYAGPTTQTSK